LNFKVLNDPFPHILGENIWNKEELKLIWEELQFFNKKHKLKTAEGFAGVVDKTNSLGIVYDQSLREVSNLHYLNTKLFEEIRPSVIELSESNLLLKSLPRATRCTSKLRYYENGAEYKTHIDMKFVYLIFMYFHKTPKKFKGGELIFEEFNYEFAAKNNSLIAIPGCVPHGVRKVEMDEKYNPTHGRYCFSMFLELPDRV